MVKYQSKYDYKVQGTNPELAAQANALGEALGKYYVAYHLVLVDITGSPKAALMLGHALQCTRMAILNHQRANGSFWKTAREWYVETGLSVREIESARKTLKDLGILIEVRQGMPAKLWYTLNLNKLAAMICKHANITYRDWSWETRQLKALLGKAVITYAPFAWAAGSAVAGLYLSRLYSDTRFACSNSSLTIRRNNETWIKAPIRDSLHDLRLGRKSLMNARAKLVDAGLIAELRDARIQSNLITRILLDVAPSKIALEVNKHRSLSEYDKQVSRNTTNNMYPKRVTRDTESAKQEIPKAQNNIYPLRRTSYAVSALPIYKEDLYTTKQLQHKAESGQEPEPARVLSIVQESVPATKPLLLDSNLLVFPAKIALLQEKQSVLTLFDLKQIRDLTIAQLLLDELAGNMQHRPVHNPIGYLKILVDNQLAGTLIVNYAHKVRYERERRQQVATQRQVEQEQASLLPSTPEDVIARNKGIALIEKMRKQRALSAVRTE